MRALALAIVVTGCTQPALDRGRDLFSDPELSTAGSNVFSCATCHEVSQTRQKLLPGYTIFDVTNRPSWWGGFELTLIGALNQCVTNFMRGAPLDASDVDARALNVYLESLSPGPTASPLPLTVIANIVDVPSGDAAEGKQIYDQSCGNCHGAPNSGNGRISGAASIIPDETIESFGTDPLKGARPVTIEKVRHGKFFSIGGNMPLFSVEAMSEAQLGQVLGYLETVGLPK